MTGGAATYDRIVWGPNAAEVFVFEIQKKQKE